MNRNNIYTVNPLYNGSTTQTTEDGSVQSGGTTIIYQQGGGTGLTDAQKQKLDGIQEGAEVNQNAYSKVRLNGSDALIVEAKNKTDILNMSGVYPIAIAINDNGGLDFTVSSDQSNTNSVVTQAQLKAALDQLEKDQYWKVDADGKLYTELDVYSHKEISAYGAGTGGGGTGGAGALYECADVLRDGDKVKGAEVGSVLSYNGTHWYAIPQSAIVPDLSGYATKSYVSQEINDLIGGAPGTLDTLKEIAEALGNDPNFATTITNMINNIGLRVDDIEARVVSLEDMFEWDKSASASDSSLWRIKAKRDLFGVGEISAYGAGTGGGGTGGAGALYECADVLRDGDKVKGAEVGSVLSYNGTHWYAIPQSAIVPDLSGYATKSYVSQEINDLIGGAPGTLDTLKEIAEALGNDPNFATTITNMINNIGLRVDDIEARVVSLEDMFEWDKSASASDSSLWRIKAKRDLFGVGEISAYGYSAGTVPTGAQYLYELKDVQLTDLATGQLLQYNGSKWVNIDKNAVGLNETELGRYLTNNNYAKKTDITWANLLNKPTTWAWADITGKPTTLAGYGITDAVISSRQVLAGNGLTGGGALSSDVTISLGTIGTAGTYTKVTTDMYGRVVSGAALSEGDIPTLQISKISGLQTALDSKLNISDFSTWFTINKNASGQVVSIQANFDFFGVGEISAYGLGETQPSVTTLAGLDDVTITSPANGQTLIYDSATSQWKNGTIIGGGNISLNGTVYKPVNGTITLPNLYEKVSGGTSSQFLKADGSVDGNRYWEYSHVSVPESIDFTYHDGKLRLIQNNSGTSVGPTMYWGGLSAISNYNGFQLVVYGGTTEAYYIRKTADNNTWSDWSQLITSRNYEGIVGNKFVLKAGDTMTGRLTAPFFRANNMISVGVPVEQLSSSRAELNIITLTNNPCDIWMGANNQRYWSITARDSTENYQLGIYNSKVSSWNAIFRDNINDFYVKTEVRDTFLVLPTTGGSYNEGIRIGNASNGWSNIQFGSQNAWNGKVDGQWIIGRNPVKYFQICLAGTETANTSKPGKGISIDINGYLDTGYIRPNIDTEYKANYFYASDDSFIRRTTWNYALNCLNQNQLTLDLSSLDSNKWYPCTINAPAYGGTPLRITIFNGLRGNKPSWASHSSGFSLLLDYYVTGSGWGTLSAVSKLDWYHGSYGGETAFGGRQQNTMGSAEIVYLRGGGVYYYRTTNHGQLTVHPNGYSWASGSYTYSAAVKTSQDNSPMEKTFDQVYWAPANLRTTRNLWGQPFNGTSDVSGALQYVTTINASSTIYTGGDIIAYSRLFCGGYLYVHRNAYSGSAAPAISLAIGDTDTGFNWYSDGAVRIYSNGSAVGMWTGSEFRYGHGYFKQASGNDYSQLGIMVNGNGTANTIKPGIGFHQPGVFAGSIRMNDGSTFGLYTQGGSGLANLRLNGWYTNFGYINGDGIHLSSGWLRTVGATGWYNETYAGGMYMADGTWIRTYNGRKFYVDNAEVDAILTQGGFRSNGNSQVGLQIDGSESTRTIIYGKIGSTVNSVVARYAVNWYSEWARFDVHRGGGTDILKFSWKHNDTELMYLGMGGYFQVNGTIVSTGEVTAYSDIRLKTNIKPLDYKGRLAPKWFIKDNKPSIGFIAQEVQALYPELVKVNTSTIENYLSLNYGAITAVLSAQVNKVEDEVEVLKNRIRQLENEVALLKQKP